ncbi:MAG: DUF3237 domain-containing protein, partial [Caulobacter sp.]
PPRHPSRRGVTLAAALAPVQALAAERPDAQVAPPALAHVFDLLVEVGPAQELGEVGGGRRRVIPITGGRLEGPGLSGRVLAGGADWQTIRPDGVTLLQARYTVRMSDGTTVGIVNTGVRRAPPEVVARLTAGEDVDPRLYYFRATPVFEVGPGPFS